MSRFELMEWNGIQKKMDGSLLADGKEKFIKILFFNDFWKVWNTFDIKHIISLINQQSWAQHLNHFHFFLSLFFYTRRFFNSTWVCGVWFFITVRFHLHSLGGGGGIRNGSSLCSNISHSSANPALPHSQFHNSFKICLRKNTAGGCCWYEYDVENQW